MIECENRKHAVLALNKNLKSDVLNPIILL